MLTVEELRKLRNDKVFEELSKPAKPKKGKPERKRGTRPPDAKAVPDTSALDKLPEKK